MPDNELTAEVKNAMKNCGRRAQSLGNRDVAPKLTGNALAARRGCNDAYRLSPSSLFGSELFLPETQSRSHAYPVRISVRAKAKSH